ncbi:COG1361 S-layer family protein [Archaeoglobus neptunius]|uniref:COG1361 S-layer family protein n=1 Tax=Archaeoglobus neptunius TaxID=2798580 RepID=UPI001E5074EF|nr:S-layer protein [Archaeoglobus neptunius]
MRRVLLVLTILILLSGVASALDYEKKPEIKVSYYGSKYGSNYFQRGAENLLTVVIFNDAKNEKIEYANSGEAKFFSGRENMLFTAYDVDIALEGCEGITVKTPEQNLPALPPMQPQTLNFVIEIGDAVSPGDYKLNLKVEYYIIDRLDSLVPFPITTVPEQENIELNSGTPTGNGTIVYVYQYQTQYYELTYTRKTDTIPLTIHVEQKPVTLQVVEVKSYNLYGESKGKITVTVKNVGDKTARSAYLVLDTPSGIEASGLSFAASAEPQGAAGVIGMQNLPVMPEAGGMGLTGMPGMATLPGGTASAKGGLATYYIGDLKPGETAEATFYLKINMKEGGVYPLHIKAVYLDDYGKLTESDSTTFGIKVKDAPEIKVKNVESRVYVNARGDVTVILTSNTDLKDVSVKITAQPPLSVLSSEYYVGDVKAGEDFTAVFKLKASSEANPVTYPADITVVFKSMDEYIELDPIRIGVKVNPKMEFKVIGKPRIAAGESKIITFTVRNAGQFEVKDATARLTIVDPFSSSDDTAYLGNLKPGESANASFKISVDSDATPKVYALNLEVKYKDPEGEWAFSEPTKAIIEVTPARPPYVLYGIVVLIVVVSVIVYLRKR